MASRPWQRPHDPEERPQPSKAILVTCIIALAVIVPALVFDVAAWLGGASERYPHQNLRSLVLALGVLAVDLSVVAGQLRWRRLAWLFTAATFLALACYYMLRWF